MARFAAGSENARVAARRRRLSAHPAPRTALSRAGRPWKQSTTAGPVASKLSAPSSAVGGESSRIGVRVGRPRERTGPGAASAGEARSDPQARKQSGPVPTDWKPHVGTSAPERGGRERVRWGACAGVPPGATLAYTGRSFRGRRRRSAGDGADAMGRELFRRDVWRRDGAPRQKPGAAWGTHVTDAAGHRWSAETPTFRVTACGVTTPHEWRRGRSNLLHAKLAMCPEPAAVRRWTGQFGTRGRSERRFVAAGKGDRATRSM